VAPNEGRATTEVQRRTGVEKVDIGIAMGNRRTQFARDAADIVLQNDALASIIAPVHEGRVIFANIQKFVLYLWSATRAR